MSLFLSIWFQWRIRRSKIMKNISNSGRIFESRSPTTNTTYITANGYLPFRRLCVALTWRRVTSVPAFCWRNFGLLYPRIWDVTCKSIPSACCWISLCPIRSSCRMLLAHAVLRYATSPHNAPCIQRAVCSVVTSKSSSHVRQCCLNTSHTPMETLIHLPLQVH